MKANDCVPRVRCSTESYLPVPPFHRCGRGQFGLEQDGHHEREARERAFVVPALCKCLESAGYWISPRYDATRAMGGAQSLEKRDDYRPKLYRWNRWSSLRRRKWIRGEFAKSLTGLKRCR